MYRYMCQYIVGTEDHVNRIRVMNAVRDNVAGTKMLTFITSGSYGEGLDMRGSDYDYMMVNKNYEVCEDVNSDFNPNTTCFLMETDDVKPGFTRLRLRLYRHEILNRCEEHNGNVYFSSALFKQFYLTPSLTKIHGPCVTNEKQTFDGATCVHCKTWVSSAIQWITRSNQMSNVDGSMWNFSFEPQPLYVNEVGKILKSKLLNPGMVTSEIMQMETFNESIKQTVYCQQSSIKDVFKYYLSKKCNGEAQCIALDNAISNNKYRYKQFTTCLSFLLKNVYHDAVSGWLMLASLFYKTKQYSKALHITMYSMSKCTTEKLYHDVTLSDVHYQVLKLQTLQKKGFAYLLKIMFVDYIQFEVDSTLLPDELQIESVLVQFFQSMSYAYFLNFLCHYHLNNVIQCQDSLQGLQLVIDEEYLMADIIKGNDYTLLWVVLQLLGDRESARQAFFQSVELFPYQLFNSAAMRLFLMR
ncbi:unnamed protein product [Mytilus coruscus]|uniref:Mab-21-like HhH/H2TH-like domain-containing protein n=1 Tax=Mytilus coruscus TaxID=42192 RepID=A0A6J8EFP9_MYTCO|nr:unnamed protein product [Mytilus coruscus]